MCNCRKCKGQASKCQCKACEENDKCKYPYTDDCRWERIGGKKGA